MRGSGEARLVASGAVLQQLAQGFGLLALLAIVTLLARRLSVAELGAYGLVASLAGYLLVLRNSVASSAVRAMAAAEDREQRADVFAAAAQLYGVVGVATGVLIALVAVVLAGTVLDGALAHDARVGGIGLGVLTAIGIEASVNLDGLRAERMFPSAAGAEIVSVVVYLALMVTLILSDVDLAPIIALSGALPFISGVICGLLIRRAGLPFRVGARALRRGAFQRHRSAIVPTAGWLLVIELSNLFMYASGRMVLGAYRTPAAVGMYEGPVRAHNLLYALGGALAVPTVPTASRYAASGDERRLRELAVRGSRYTLALFVPLSVTLMALAQPILGVWLGQRYTGGATALTVLVAYWLLYGALVVTPGFLVGVGRARQLARLMVLLAVCNLALALVLTPKVGVEGPALATTIPFVLAFPLILRNGLLATGVQLSELLRRAFVPAYLLGAALAACLLVLRFALGLEGLVAVGLAAAGGVLSYWALFHRLVLDASERELVRDLFRRAR
jgi:O-antigen/teichoic acid export membrane protein